MIYAVDIETFSTKSDAVVAAIGIARDDGKRWYWRLRHNVTPQGVRTAGGQSDRRVDAPTLEWWEQAPEDAWHEAFDSEGRIDHALAIMEMCIIFSRDPATEIWARGSMDQRVLEDMIAKTLGESHIPWPYNVWRDERTITAALVGIETKKAGAHRADDDATACLHNAINCSHIIKSAVEDWINAKS